MKFKHEAETNKEQKHAIGIQSTYTTYKDGKHSVDLY